MTNNNANIVYKRNVVLNTEWNDYCWLRTIVHLSTGDRFRRNIV